MYVAVVGEIGVLLMIEVFRLSVVSSVLCSASSICMVFVVWWVNILVLVWVGVLVFMIASECV